MPMNEEEDNDDYLEELIEISMPIEIDVFSEKELARLAKAEKEKKERQDRKQA